jgi:4-hydroxy-tetrahydrodipicolinate synthase
MVNAALANDFAAATKLHRKLYPISKAIFIEPNPVPVKAALAAAGRITSAEVRAPLSPLLPATQKVLAQALSDLRS